MDFMKKYIFFIAVVFSLVSCQEDVTFNNPSVQGMKDNLFWRAIQSNATLASDGSLLIQAYTGSEILSLKTTGTIAQTYVLGINDSNKVTYVVSDANGSTTFSTGPGIGNGQIVVTEYDAINKTITGSFKFNAEITHDTSFPILSVNFQQGVFYKVPISSLAQ